MMTPSLLRRPRRKTPLIRINTAVARCPAVLLQKERVLVIAFLPPVVQWPPAETRYTLKPSGLVVIVTGTRGRCALISHPICQLSFYGRDITSGTPAVFSRHPVKLRDQTFQRKQPFDPNCGPISSVPELTRARGKLLFDLKEPQRAVLDRKSVV